MFRLKLCIAMVVAVGATSASASPLFRIGEGSSTSWADAVAGPVQAMAAGSTFVEDLINTSSPGSLAFRQSQLTPVNPVSDGFEDHDALVMSWEAATGLPEDMNLTYAGWEYVYGVDPDLNGTLVEFSVFPPPGIWDLVFELEDIFGNSRAWLTVGPVPAWATVQLDPSIAGPQGIFGGFSEELGFDLSQVIRIRLWEAGGLVGEFPPDPSIGTFAGAWNAWNHLEVFVATPEPATSVLALFGAVLLLARRRKIAG